MTVAFAQEIIFKDIRKYKLLQENYKYHDQLEVSAHKNLSQ